jgi:ATP adenylyltransferase
MARPSTTREPSRRGKRLRKEGGVVHGPLKALWAPWRLESVLAPKAERCIFCQFPSEDRDRENLVLGRSARSFVMLNKFPYNSGHLMVIPRRHVSDLTALADDEFADLHELLKTSVAVVAKAYRPEGFNVGMNLGRVAGAGIDDHLHYHVVPRWNGDCSFMPVLSETKVMVEHLQSSFDRLRRCFDEALGR